MQTNLFEAHARRTDPETSHAAAESVRNLRMSQSYVLSILREVGPMTDECLQGWIDPKVMSPSGIRTRRSELVKLGKVEWSGEKVPMSTGRMARVWRAR